MALVIGTAGHIDHGKPALVHALTGQDTDRLPEERLRGISIDLGFAYYTSRTGERIGVVDVPGHERFIRNMLAGAHGIDLALFVIAADDGVMPQSEEHLDILHLLGVRRGIFVVTKTDLVEPARVAAVRDEIAVLAHGSRLEGVPVVPVSSVTGVGLAELRGAIEAEIDRGGAPPSAGPFRLPLDRAFVVRGHGVVVTGTIVAGGIDVGAPVRILPGDAVARVRGVEIHGTAVSTGHQGQRAALNLSGVDRAMVGRGKVVCDALIPGATRRLDARVEVRRTAPQGIRNHRRVRVHLGTAEALGRVVVRGQERTLAPGAAGWAQLRLRAPVVALRGDRFILRDETGRWSLGGGEVVLPFAAPHRGSETDLSARLERLRGSDVAVAAGAFLDLTPAFAVDLAALSQVLALPETVVAPALVAVPAIESIASDAGGPALYTTVVKRDRLCADILSAVGTAHMEEPLARGAEMESVRRGLRGEISARAFRWCVERLVSDGSLVRDDNLLHLPSHRVELGGTRAALAAQVETMITSGGFTPPDVRQLEEMTDADRRTLIDVLTLLERGGRVVRIAPDLFYAPAAVEEASRRLTAHCRENGAITAAAFRDAMGTSRKFAIGFLEWCDRTGLTLRVGDVRKLRR